MPFWRHWTARLSLQRAMLREQFSDLRGKQEVAQKRAEAAEFIAQEASAARLKALLEAAREQAAVRSIETAEQRYAAAKDEWEAAHQTFPSPEEDAPDAAIDGAAAESRPSRVAAGNAPDRAAVSVRLAGMGLAIIAALVAVGLYLKLGPDATVSETSDAAHAGAPPSDTIINRAVATADPASSPEAQAPASPEDRNAAGVGSPLAREGIAGPAALVETGVSRPVPTVPVTVALPVSIKTAARATEPARPAGAPTPGRNPFHDAVQARAQPSAPTPRAFPVLGTEAE